MNGVRNVADYNGAEQFGSFMYQVTQKNGERCSAAKGYLTPNLSRPNLTVRDQRAARRASSSMASAPCGVAYS